MKKKISIRFSGLSFDMELEEGFAMSLEPELAHLFNLDGNNSVKHLLEAYIKKSYEVYLLKRTVKENITKLS